MLLWFRNDLRVHDNEALDYIIKNRSEGRTSKALFFISEKQWQQHDLSLIKIDFIKRHVEVLKQQLLILNIELDIIETPDFSSQITELTAYCNKHNISQVIANSEVELNEQQRDNALIKHWHDYETKGANNAISLTLFESDVVVPKGQVLNQSGTMFKVFTPFKKSWLNYVKERGFNYIQKYSELVTDNSALTPTQNGQDDDSVDRLSNAWPLASVVEKQVIPEFLRNKISDYQKNRDIPSIKGTSGLSPYLAIGAISPRYLLMLLLNKHPDLLVEPEHELFSWLNELIWREFYRHLLFHFPKLHKHHCFNDKYQHTQWFNNIEYFTAWCEGKTGYPLVDAAMQQLKQTGWMHNRLRMVVASFLTKHLLIDWRWGEKYFMQQLIDGDLAANNGGWQWAASTGCDAQPYFRIFNPIRQSERFDPNGDFIRKYLPELKDIPNKDIHFPHKYIEKHNLQSYWPAIVDHKTAREQALAFYK